jgi:hypothetical protein
LGLIKPFLPSAQASIKIIHSKTYVGLLVDEIPNLNQTKASLESNQIPTKVIPIHCFYKKIVSTILGQQSSRQNAKANKKSIINVPNKVNNKRLVSKKKKDGACLDGNALLTDYALKKGRYFGTQTTT